MATIAAARARQWQRLSRAKVRDWPRLAEEDRQTLRMTFIHADRREQLGQLDGSMSRAKALQRDKCLGQIGVTAIGDEQPDWERIFMPTGQRYRDYLDKYMGGTALVIHIGPSSGPSLCGATKGRVVGDPTTVMLLKDRYCSRCWNRWSRERSRDAAR